jgi:hypothetical protein
LVEIGRRLTLTQSREGFKKDIRRIYETNPCFQIKVLRRHFLTNHRYSWYFIYLFKKLSHISITSYIYHFFVVKIFRILSHSFFEIFNIILSIIVTCHAVELPVLIYLYLCANLLI